MLVRLLVPPLVPGGSVVVRCEVVGCVLVVWVPVVWVPVVWVSVGRVSVGCVVVGRVVVGSVVVGRVVGRVVVGSLVVGQPVVGSDVEVVLELVGDSELDVLGELVGGVVGGGSCDRLRVVRCVELTDDEVSLLDESTGGGSAGGGALGGEVIVASGPDRSSLWPASVNAAIVAKPVATRMPVPASTARRLLRASTSSASFWCIPSIASHPLGPSGPAGPAVSHRPGPVPRAFARKNPR